MSRARGARAGRSARPLPTCAAVRGHRTCRGGGGRARSSLRLQPDNARAHNNRGSALQMLGRVAEAEHAFRRALELAPDLPQPYPNLGTSSRSRARPTPRTCTKRPSPAASIRKLSAMNLPRAWPADRSRTGAVGALDVRQLRADVRRATACARVQRPGTARRDVAARVSRTRGPPGSRLRHRTLRRGAGPAQATPDRRRSFGKDARAGPCASRLRRAARRRDQCVARDRRGGLDVVVAADVFIYIGALDRVFAHVARVLRPNGWFAFTTEELRELRLRCSPPDASRSRTRTSRGSPPRRSRFTVAAPAVIRTESGMPVAGASISCSERRIRQFSRPRARGTSGARDPR